MLVLRLTVTIWVIAMVVPGRASAGVVWSEEFNGDVIDTDTWTYDVGGWGFGNGQFEYNTARSANSYIENGSLVIEARREDYEGNAFTSARMLTQGRFAFKYGSLEARIKLPDTANGLWPAFWLLGNNFPAVAWPGCGEADILEMGSSAGIAEGLQRRKINAAIHFSDAGNRYGSASAWLDAPVDLNLDYHLYKVSWTPSQMTFYLDGASFGTWDITPDHFAEFHQPMFLILNMAVGGWDPSYTGVYSPGAVTATFPAKMYVDWIRLSSNEYTELYLGENIEERGSFGVFSETSAAGGSLSYGDDSDPRFAYGTAAALYTWNNMTAATPPAASEGSECWSFTVAAGSWFGMGVLVPNFRNMKRYADGYLHLDIRSTSPAAMKIGIKSSRGGEFWLPLGDESDEFGFARDGGWHAVRIPLNRFANIDFHTVHQMFMLAGDPPAAGFTLSIDNVWWEPTSDRPAPGPGNFGVFTEDAAHRDAGEFELGADGDFFIWEHTLVNRTQHPQEGTKSISLQSAPGQGWFGAGFTPNRKYDLSGFRFPQSKLCFSMKTLSSTSFMIGMKSGNVLGIGQKFIPFRPGNDPYGFVRDGQWHRVEIPMSDLATDVDLFEVSQLFQILGTAGPISDIEIDDIYFSAGGEPRRPASVRIFEAGGIIDFSFLTDHLTSYRILHKDSMDDPNWACLRTVAGNGSMVTTSDLGAPQQRNYAVKTIR